MKQQAYYSQSGFALAWVAVLAILAGTVSVTLVNVLQSQQGLGVVVQTRSNIERVADAIKAFQRVNGILPCPSSLTIAQATAGFGVARDKVSGPPSNVCNIGTGGAGDGSGSTVNTVVLSPGAARVGAVPTRTLGLPDEVGQDKWGSRLMYAVVENKTRPADYATAVNNLSINRNGSPVMSNLAFIVFSQGQDKAGAYSLVTGKAVRPCNGSDNCNNDRVFEYEDPDLIMGFD